VGLPRGDNLRQAAGPQIGIGWRPLIHTSLRVARRAIGRYAVRCWIGGPVSGVAAKLAHQHMAANVHGGVATSQVQFDRRSKQTFANRKLQNPNRRSSGRGNQRSTTSEWREKREEEAAVGLNSILGR
jgi:hypothetical protein